MKNVRLQKKLVLSALFAALISAACFIQIPLPGGIPIVLQDMMAMLSGLLLGPIFGGLAVLIFLLLGSIGLPVFSGKAGLHILLNGPTSGFLWGYLLAAIIGGLFLRLTLSKTNKSASAQWLLISVAALLSTIIAFACGIAGGIIIMKISFAKAIASYLLPFIPGNLVKLVLMILLCKKLRPTIISYTN
ncbi:MAG: biotin transporter BioY [Treponema sp.]|nr:biotin transporter BioY [Treponema sp.]